MKYDLSWVKLKERYVALCKTCVVDVTNFFTTTVFPAIQRWFWLQPSGIMLCCPCFAIPVFSMTRCCAADPCCVSCALRNYVLGMYTCGRSRCTYSSKWHNDILGLRKDSVRLPYSISGPGFGIKRSSTFRTRIRQFALSTWAMRGFLEREFISTPEWPAKSLDCNIIENLWGYMKSHIDRSTSPPTNLKETDDAVQNSFNEICTPDYCSKMISSFPRTLTRWKHLLVSDLIIRFPLNN